MIKDIKDIKDYDNVEEIIHYFSQVGHSFGGIKSANSTISAYVVSGNVFGAVDFIEDMRIKVGVKEHLNMEISNCAIINTFYICDKYRKQGYGKKMVNEVAKYLAKQKVKTLITSTSSLADKTIKKYIDEELEKRNIKVIYI